MVNLEAASFETGSGFSREYFIRAANPLGSLRLHCRSEYRFRGLFSAQRKRQLLSLKRQRRVQLCEPARNSGGRVVLGQPGPGEAVALRRQGAPVPRSAAPSQGSAVLPRAGRPAQPCCWPVRVFSFFYGRFRAACVLPALLLGKKLLVSPRGWRRHDGRISANPWKTGVGVPMKLEFFENLLVVIPRALPSELGAEQGTSGQNASGVRFKVQ